MTDSKPGGLRGFIRVAVPFVFVPALAVMKLPFLPVNFTGCIKNTPSRTA